MTNELIQIQNGKVGFDSFIEAAQPVASSGGCGSGKTGGCGCASDKGSTPFSGNAANFIPLEAVSKSQVAPIEISDVREKLDGKSGPEYWRSLNELSQKPEFEDLMAREFQGGAPASWTGVSRRNFLRLMGASLALAGLAGCAKQPEERIVPYVKSPEDLIPGRPLFFASAVSRGGYAHGVLVESHMGRPTKIEGNPDHPSSLGKTDAITQAALLTMYDPDRSQNVTKNGEASSWESFMGEARDLIAAHKTTRGAGLRILTETVTSPTLAFQMQELLRALPEARWHAWEPAGRDNARMGAKLAFGSDANVVYRFDQADVIVSLDSNFLMDEPGSVRYAQEFSDGRRVRTRKNETKMNRLYVVESTPTITGANADHRWPAKASEIAAVAQNILARDTSNPVAGAAVTPQKLPASISEKQVGAVIADLQSARGRSVVIAGQNQPPEVHALALRINSQLGNIGKTVLVTDPIEASPSDTLTSLKNLASDMNAGRVETLIVIGSNPVYSAPADLKFVDAFKKVRNRIRLGLYNDETSDYANWHIPQSHFLEEWSDLRAHDGTVSIVQPLILPLYDTVSVHQLLSVLLGNGDRNGYNIVRDYWKSREIYNRFLSTNTPKPFDPQKFETWWRKSLNDGIIAESVSLPKDVAVKPSITTAGSTPSAANGIEITFHPDPHIGDGRDANNGWLQELPRPMTKITWDNAALVSLNTARKLDINNYEMVKISVGGRSVQMPVWIMPGQPDDSVAVQLGFGRTRGGQVGNNVGFNANMIRSSNSLWFGQGATIEKTDGSLYTLAVTQEHHTLDNRIPNSPASGQKAGANGDKMDGFHDRRIIQVLDIADFLKDKNQLREAAHGGGHEEEGHAPKGHEEETHAGARAKGSTPSTETKGHAGEGHAEEDHSGEASAHPNLMPPVWPSDRLSLDKNGVPEYGQEPKGYAGNPVPAWGMTIDLNTCIGCNACTMACQAENNISVVGKEEVVRGREMHWIRVDRYYRDDVANPEMYHQPVACMHCEKAPCEPVCPVEATSHSVEGINEMTYNRCVGTKYCSNNCPYKVRRFNFLQYSEQDNPTLVLMKNPDVTVRSRGVMEKCTFCIQRINEVRWQAEKEDRPIKDGEIVTACQQACPTNAIIFGNVSDKNSMVYESKAEPHNYTLLPELNTLPRTTYLAKFRNPNPALEKKV